MKVRTHITIDIKTDKKFRDKFVRKKGDYSDKIEELMKESFKNAKKDKSKTPAEYVPKLNEKRGRTSSRIIRRR